VLLTVSKHCFCNGPRGQAQVKVKLRIENRTNKALPIGTTHLRILVPGPLAGAWTPPVPSGDPLSIQNGSNTFIALPANAAEAYEKLDDGNDTFASHWPTEDLAPGEAFFDDALKKGDLVFYVPSPQGSITVLGIGYVDDTGTLLGFTPVSDWQGLDDASNF
jgi:hypothetical protein